MHRQSFTIRPKRSSSAIRGSRNAGVTARNSETQKGRDPSSAISQDGEPDNDHLQKAASRYLEIARTTAGRTSTIAVLWLAAVLVTWWSIELDVQDRAKEISTAATEFREASAKLSIVQRDKQNAAKLTTDAAAKLPKRQDGAETRLTAAAKEVAYYKGKLISFQLPGFQKFEVPSQFAPSVLCVVILFFAIYLTSMRRRTFLFLGKGLRIMLGELRTPMDQIGDVLGPRVWSIMPLPRHSGTVVLADDFAKAFGWRSPQQERPIGVLIFWLVLVALQLRLTTLGAELAQPLVDVSLGRPETHYVRDTGLLSLYAALLLATVSLGISWFLPSSVADGLLEPDVDVKFERRHFMVHGGVGLAGFALTAASPTTTTGTLRRITRLLEGTRNPRFRKQAALVAAAGPEGLRLSARSRILRLVRDGRIVGTRNPKVTVLDSIAPPEALTGDSRAVPEGSNVSVVVEYAARKALAEEKIDLAMTILLDGIRTDFAFKKKAGIMNASTPSVPSVSVRLYDLIARESLRAGKLEWRTKLLAFIRENELSTVFADRERKWTNPQSKWHRSIVMKGRSSNVG